MVIPPMSSSTRAYLSTTPTKPPDPVFCAGFVVFKKVHPEPGILYLLLKHSAPPHHWSFPKGHLNPDETAMTAAFRETREETGLRAEMLSVLPYKKVVNYEARGRPKFVTYWIAKLLNQRAEVTLSEEHTEYKWVEYSEACDLLQFDSLKELLTDCDKFVNYGPKDPKEESSK